MNLILLHILNVLAFIFERTYIAGKHTYVLGYVLGTYVRRIDIKDAIRVLGQHVETINYQFVYA